MDRITRQTILKQEYKCCFRCGSTLNPEWHHGVITADKRFKKYLDVKENGIRLCHKCNVSEKGFVENFWFRNLVFNYKLRLGYDMWHWLSRLPMRTKDKFYKLSDKEYNLLLKELTFRKWNLAIFALVNLISVYHLGTPIFYHLHGIF